MRLIAVMLLLVSACCADMTLSTSNAPVRVAGVTIRVQPAPSEMAFIPGGVFNYSDNPLAAGSTCMVSAFWMDKYEVSWQKWTNVYQWATNNNYTFDGDGAKYAITHPAHTISWWDCVKWCNARSEMQGLAVCYYTDAYQTGIYRVGDIDISNSCVRWTANGYRLPTEAEWEKAARGGSNGNRFPWTDEQNIQHARATYRSETNAAGVATYAYDTSPTRNYHPVWGASTSPCGYFAPNGYGLYDMAGNVWEWCWDWYGGTYPLTRANPQGPTTGTYRVLRGGSWVDNAVVVRVAFRNYGNPSNRVNNGGFRVVRGLK